MKKLTLFILLAGLALSSQALPVYDNFSTYGAAGVWTQVTNPPVVAYTTGAPLLGGNTAPSGESWILYTNAPPADLYSNFYSSAAFTGYDSQNVGVVNYFATGQTGNSDSVSALALPAGFPGPLVPGHDTSANSVWTPGWAQTDQPSQSLQNYLGGIGACLQFSSDIPGTTGNKVYASFYVDVPDTSGSFGSGQSLDHGYSAGFLPMSEIPSPTANQGALPGYSISPYPSCPLFEKFNMRATATSASANYLGWRAGVFDTDANATSAGGLPAQPHQIHFVVLAYEFFGGATLDVERVWIDPPASTFAAGNEPTVTTSSYTAMATHNPASGFNLPDIDGFFFLANTQDGGATPNSGVLYNSLSIGTNWAYVTGGLQSTACKSVTVAAGQTAVLYPPLAAGGGVSATNVTWANSSGPLSGGRYSVNPVTGVLTITGVVAGDGDVYTASGTTAIAAENSVAAFASKSAVPLTVITSGNASAIQSSQFTLNFTGPVGVGYRIWSTTSLQPNYPVLGSPGWTLVTSGTYSSGINSYPDSAASSQTKYYTITVP